MQPLHAVFAIAIAFAVTFSNACLVFDAIYNIGTSKITGTMTDNGQKTCEFSGTVEKDKKSLYASCIDGFASYIRTDLEMAAYSNHGNEHMFHVEKESHSMNPRNQYYTLSARIYC
ncbi:hypothetical protein V490_08104 [Pseudogymnoascus sp. VKM F-3557]|nr:hypothetical protein V490_08104 [Pseudogymnoascus sp. VKM F-3557]